MLAFPCGGFFQHEWLISRLRNFFTGLRNFFTGLQKRYETETLSTLSQLGNNFLSVKLQFNNFPIELESNSPKGKNLILE